MVDKMDQLGIFHNEEIKPLAYRARPTKLEDFVGQTFSIRIIQKMIEKKKLVNMLIYGPSGCGKTTLLRMIAGFISPDEGQIKVNGERIDILAPNKRNVNTVFQNYALFPNLSLIHI